MFSVFTDPEGPLTDGKIRISAHVRSVIDPDGAIVLDLKRGRYFSLNGAAAAMWRRIEAGMPASAIEQEFRTRYPQVDSIERDLAAFVTALRNAELIDAIK